MNCSLELDPPDATGPQGPQLYPWQQQAVEHLRANIRNGTRRQVLCAPTGAGKTVLATHLIGEMFAKGKRGLFLCDRIPLIDQTSRTFDAHSIPHGVIQAQHWRWEPYQRVQVASVQTVQRRNWPQAELLVVDECHTLYKTTTAKLALDDCFAVGLTATPFSRGLGKHYQAIVSVTTTRSLIEGGYLCPYTIFAPSEPDMTGAKVVAGEWTESEAEKRSLPIVGDCVAEYLRHADGRKFIAFGVTVAHCEELRRQFLAAGVMTEPYTYRTGDDERAATLEEFSRPDSSIRGLVSVAALAKGFDRPDVGCVIIARPLRKSLTEHIQMLGRGLRVDPANLSKNCVILDHSGNSVRFWDEMNTFFEDGWHELDDGKPKKKKSQQKKQEPRKCPRCAHVHMPRPTCPICGHEYPQRSVLHEDGELAEIGAGGAETRVQREQFYRETLGLALERGWKTGFAAHLYREKFGVWPARVFLTDPLPASAAVRSYVRSRLIRHAKSAAR